MGMDYLGIGVLTFTDFNKFVWIILLNLLLQLVKYASKNKSVAFIFLVSERSENNWCLYEQHSMMMSVTAGRLFLVYFRQEQ